MKRLVLALVALAAATVAFASSDPVADTRQILAGTVTTKSVKDSYLNGSRDGTSAFQGALKAYKAIRAAEAPSPPPPVVTPPPAPPAIVANLNVSMGDSISVCWSGSHTGIYAAAHPKVDFRCMAVAGTGLSQVESNLQKVLDLKPEKLPIFIGANDTPDQAWHDRLMAVVAKAKAIGTRVYVGTLLPQNPGVQYTAAFNAARPAENTRIRADAAGKGYVVIDFAADFAAWSSDFFGDYVHPNEAGQKVMSVRYSAALDGTAPPAPPVEAVDPLIGEKPIASNFDPMTQLQATWGSGSIPASAGADVLGAFRFILQDAGLSYDDAIVYPNQPGKSHLHQYYGHKCPANATYASLRAGAVPGAQNSDNPSCYWMPAMLDGIGNVVRPDFVSIYYKRRPKSDPVCSFAPGTPVTPLTATDQRFAQGICVNLPNGLKFIFGYDMLTGQAPTGKLWYNCQGAGSTPGKYATLPEAAAKCPAGAQLGAIIEAPDCWDGKNLDSANHRDHVAYASYGTWGYLKCPSTHPYVIPTFTLGAWFTSDANTPNWRLSSDEMMPNLPRGTTFHADFFMAWDPIVKDMWHANCIDKKLNCSGGDLGNGLQLKNFSASPRNPNRLVPVASIPLS